MLLITELTDRSFVSEYKSNSGLGEEEALVGERRLFHPWGLPMEQREERRGRVKGAGEGPCLAGGDPPG